MKLIIGGYAQNKLSYVMSQYVLPSSPASSDEPLSKTGKQLLQREFPDNLTYWLLDENTAASFHADDLNRHVSGRHFVIVNHLHQILRKPGSRQAAKDWLYNLEKVCKKEQAELIILCDELGCGIVPAVQEDRIWREDVGRLLCDLAARAESVERIVCGLPMRIR